MTYLHMCCSVLHCVIVCCRVLQSCVLQLKELLILHMTYLHMHTATHCNTLKELHISNSLWASYIAFSVETAMQGGEDAYNALSLEFSFRERALYFVALLWKETCNLRHPMHLRHPVSNALDSFKGALYCTNTALTFRCFHRNQATPL